jgi:hypothetical protein
MTATCLYSSRHTEQTAQHRAAGKHAKLSIMSEALTLCITRTFRRPTTMSKGTAFLALSLAMHWLKSQAAHSIAQKQRAIPL